MNIIEKEINKQILVNPEENSVVISFSHDIYPMDAVYGAAYTFIDRCFVLLDKIDENRISATLKGREKLEAADLENLAGQFSNELLSNAWRYEITLVNRPIIEAVTIQALSGAMGPPPLEDFEDFDEMDFSEETFDDPLGIALTWEEKYGNRAVSGKSNEGDNPEEPGPDNAGSEENNSDSSIET